MEAKEFFHDHPVIDKRDDGIYLYFHDLPPVLLKRPPVIVDGTPPSPNALSPPSHHPHAKAPRR